MVFLLVYHTEELLYHWQWYRIPKYFFLSREGSLVSGPLIRGLLVTCRITLVSFVLAFVIGPVTALLTVPVSLSIQRLEVHIGKNMY
ncbi:MAG: hypothetical protein JRI80_14040 [Deltaproteobacteria bacterium]|nr:hypothetical protein [Deltaproteobacteria bacterium]